MPTPLSPPCRDLNPQLAARLPKLSPSLGLLSRLDPASETVRISPLTAQYTTSAVGILTLKEKLPVNWSVELRSADALDQRTFEIKMRDPDGPDFLKLHNPFPFAKHD